MARVTIEDCLERIENKYALSVAAMKRASQIVKGSKPLCEDTDNESVVIALREIAEGKIGVVYPRGYVK